MSFFFFLVFLSDFFICISFKIENQKSFGTKLIARLNFLLLFNSALFFFFFLLIVSLNTIIPISLESFNSYGEKALENLWSFGEVISLEFFSFIILISLSQIPSIIFSFLKNEKELNKLPRFGRPFILLTLIISGIITPTIDGYTQLSFSVAAFSIYLIIINLLEKRVSVKFAGNSFFGF